MNEFRDGKRPGDDHAAAREGLHRRADRPRRRHGSRRRPATANEGGRDDEQRREFLKAAAAGSRRAALAAARRWARAADRQGRRHRRRLRRRDRGEVHAHVQRGARRRHAGRDERRFRLVPDEQPRARRQQDAGRHDRALRRPRRAATASSRARHRDGRRRGQARRAPRERERAAVRPARALAGHRLPLRSVPGLNSAEAQAKVLHAWKAGPQTVALRRAARSDAGRRRLRADASRVAPYRCPPGPYERACQVAWYFKQAKPKSKVLILDGNPDVTSKAALFKQAWAEEYKGIVEYRPNHVMTDVDVATKTAKFETADDVKADVLNVVPPHRAGNIAHAGRRDHGEQPLVRGRLPDVRVDQGEEHPRARRRDPDRAGHAEVRAHGELARRRSAAAAILRSLAGQPVEPGAGARTTRATASSPTRTSCTSRRCISTTRDKKTLVAGARARAACRRRWTRSKASTRSRGRRTSGPTC